MGDLIIGGSIWTAILGGFAGLVYLTARLLGRRAPRATALLIVFVLTPAYFIGGLLLALTIWPWRH